MRIVYASSGCNLLDVRSLGFDTLCATFTVADLDHMLVKGYALLPDGTVPWLNRWLPKNLKINE